MEGEMTPEIDKSLPPSEWYPREEVELEHGKLDVMDIKPEKLREEKDFPLVSILGFGTGNVALARTFSELQEEGEHVLGVDFVGGGKRVEGEEGSSSEFNRQGELLYQYLDKYLKDNPQIEKLDFMTQSAGLLRVLAMTKLHPEFMPKIRNLIMYSPVGIYEKGGFKGVPGMIDLGRRFRAEDKRYKKSENKSEFDQENADSLKKANERMMDFKKPGHIIKALMEVNAMARSCAYPTLEVLDAAGVNIGVIQGDSDKLASLERLLEKVGEGYEKPFGQGINPLTDETMNVYLEKEQKPPPIKVIRIVGGGFYAWKNPEERTEMTEIAGGHGIQVDSPDSAAKDIMQTKDYLNKSHS